MAKFRQGHVVLQPGKSVSFGNINSYGLRDNNGLIQFRDSSGLWKNLSGIIPAHEVESTGSADLLQITFDSTSNNILFEVTHIKIPVNINNFVAGYEAGESIISGTNNIYIGYQSSYYNQAGSYNVTIGSQAAKGTTGGEGNNPQYNVIIGYQAFPSISDAYSNVVIGSGAAFSSTNNDSCVIIGRFAGYYNQVGGNNVFVGYQAGYGTSGYSQSGNVFIGYQAGYQIVNGEDNVVIGYQAGYKLDGQTGGEGIQPPNYNVLIGYQAGYNIADADGTIAIGQGAGFNITRGSANLLLGYHAGYNITTGLGNICIGSQALAALTTQNYEFAIGYGALYQCTSTSNFAIGNNAGQSLVSGTGNTYVGNNCGYLNLGSDNLFVGRNSAYGGGSYTCNRSTYIGNDVSQNLTGTGADDQVIIGYQASNFNPSGSKNVIIGSQAGYGASGQSQNNAVLVGYRAGYSLTSASGVVVIGYESGYNLTQGNSTTLVGYRAGYSLTTPRYNTLIGYQAGYYNALGYGNTALGYLAGQGVTGNNNEYNVFIGRQAAWQITTASYNVVIGNAAGNSLTSGQSNVFIGNQAGYYETTGSNKLFIANSDTANPLIYGEFDNELLHFNGDVLIRGVSKYLNFGSLLGETGYGFRDNGGTMEVKNDGGSWSQFSSFNITPNINNLESSGIKFTSSMAQSTDFGKVCYKASDEDWYLANASDTTSALGLGIYVGDGTSSNEIMTLGFIRDDSWNFTPGAILYLGVTDGGITEVKPSLSGDTVQVIGWAYSSSIVYFNPDYTFIEVA